MDLDWSRNLTVNPRNLSLNQMDSPAPEISTSFHAPQADPFNATNIDLEPWPELPALQGNFAPTTHAGPHLEMGAFQAGMSALDGVFQFNGVLGVQVANDLNQSFQSLASYEETTHQPPNASMSGQYPLPSYMQPSLEQHQDHEPQSFNRDFQGSMAQLQADAEFVERSHAASSSPTSNRFTSQPRRTKRYRGSLLISSEKAPLRSGNSQQLKARRRLSPQKGISLFPDISQGKKLKTRVIASQPKTFFSDCTKNIDASKSYNFKFQEAIALVQESTKLFSPPFRRKARDLINQVAQLVNQLDQLAIDEEKYGNGSSDVDDDVTQPSTVFSSQDSMCNSEPVDSEPETDNTSVSSTPRQPIVRSQGPVFVEDTQQGPVHAPCLQCGIKSLYYCTREGCKYSTHSLSEWKRHEESQKHSQQERFMCLECPASPPLVDMNGDSICEFCRASLPGLGANLTTHYLQCQTAQQANTTYGRKDRLIAHLRSHPGPLNVSQIAAAGRYTVNGEWPRQCGFCGMIFNTWEERIDHVAGHFHDGLNMSSWRLPFPRPKDFRPGAKPQSKDDDNDSDDDMDDNSGRSIHQTTTKSQDSTSANQHQVKSLTRDQWRGSFDQGSVTHTDQVCKATLDVEIGFARENTASNSKTNVALERYLNDSEDPMATRSRLQGSKSVLAQRSDQKDPTARSPITYQSSKQTQASTLTLKTRYQPRDQVLQEPQGSSASQSIYSVPHVQLSPQNNSEASELCRIYKREKLVAQTQGGPSSTPSNGNDFVGSSALAEDHAIRSQPNLLSAGDNFVVFDAGGGTVDIVSFRIISLKPLLVEESAVGTYRHYGSHGIRSTHSTPGWTQNTELQNLYWSPARKSKEPSFEVLPHCVRTAYTLAKVFLGPPSQPGKEFYQCQHRSTSDGMQERFESPDNVQRHYMQSHASFNQKRQFAFDYKRSPKINEIYPRKDQYRDHFQNSHNKISTPLSPLDGMSSVYEFDDSSLALQHYGSSFSGHYLPRTESVGPHFLQAESVGLQFPQAKNVKPTPSSLGWPRDTDLLKLYTFNLHKGGEPYLQLRDEWTPTPETPYRVYLDQAKGFSKNQYPCQYPGTCHEKQNVFSRQIDLDRHYRILHADKKELFPCDHPKCGRFKEPFTRRDHYRDHLRDFHQEYIGHAKTVKDKNKDKRTWEQVQQGWLANRKICARHWRCAKCLVRNYVAQSGWECSKCKTICEEDRGMDCECILDALSNIAAHGPIECGNCSIEILDPDATVELRSRRISDFLAHSSADTLSSQSVAASVSLMIQTIREFDRAFGSLASPRRSTR